MRLTDFANLFGFSAATPKEQVIGLALSGGGARGAAHIGLLKALEEKGIFPSVLAGTSVGSIVGALYAAGNSPEEILSVFREVKLFQFSNFTMRKPGLLDPDRYRNYLSESLEGLSFEELPRKLFIVATDLLLGKQKVFTSGPVLEAVLASAAYPGVFAPMEIGRKLYVDGGVMNNLPADVIRDHCDALICMDLNPGRKVGKKDVDSTIEVVRRVMELMTRQQSVQGQGHCDLCVSSQRFEEYHIFNMDKVDELYQLGYEAALMALEASDNQFLDAGLPK